MNTLKLNVKLTAEHILKAIFAANRGFERCRTCPIGQALRQLGANSKSLHVDEDAVRVTLNGKRYHTLLPNKVQNFITNFDTFVDNVNPTSRPKLPGPFSFTLTLKEGREQTNGDEGGGG